MATQRVSPMLEGSQKRFQEKPLDNCRLTHNRIIEPKIDDYPGNARTSVQTDFFMDKFIFQENPSLIFCDNWWV
jgi:hypothetical protein